MPDRPKVNLTPEDLDVVRRLVERFNTVQVVTPDIYDLISREWPHLLGRIKTDASPPDPRGPAIDPGRA